MPSLNTTVAVGLCTAAALAGFAIGRLVPPSQESGVTEDLGAGIRAAIGEGDFLERSLQMASLLEHLDSTNLLEVVEVYDEMLAVLVLSDIRPFAIAWARFNPADALDHVLAWPPGIQRQAGVEAALEGWARRDPSTAQLAFEGAAADHPRLRERLFSGLIRGWAHSNREGLVAHVAGLEPSPRKRAIGIVVRTLMRSGGPDDTLRWADSILDDPDYEDSFKRAVFRRATSSVMRRDPARGAVWVSGRFDADYAEDALRVVAEQWGNRDGRAALEWLGGQPVGTPRDQAVREAFLLWLKADPDGAKAWLEADSLTVFHDPALLAYARHLGESTPRDAIDWCERLLEPERQQRCYKAVSIRWYQQDAAAAEAWLETSPLDEETRRKVRTRGRSGIRPTGARPRVSR